MKKWEKSIPMCIWYINIKSYNLIDNKPAENGY